MRISIIGGGGHVTNRTARCFWLTGDCSLSVPKWIQRLAISPIDTKMEKVVCHETLGGLLKHYDEGQHERLAAFPFPAIL
ncbi:MAG: hypothetical protein WCJ35_23165 [Planctomycetota bacterium]